jgi:hypothetical protein
MNNLNIILLTLNSIVMFYINAKYIIGVKKNGKKIKNKHLHYFIYVIAFINLFMSIYLILGGK